MRRRLASLALGLRRSPLGPVAALSSLTVRESVRKKVFIVLVVFTIVMLAATALLPAIRPEDRVPLVETWAQRAITFFGVMMAVFLSGVSIPDDIEERRVFTLLTKPLARWQLLAGRFTGFASLLALFGLATFCICAGFVRFVANRGGGTLANRTEYVAAEVRMEEEDGLSKVEARHSQGDPLIGLISGPGETVSVWYFRGLDLDDLPENVTAKISLEVQGPNMLSIGDFDVFLRPTTNIVPAPPPEQKWIVSFSKPPVDGEPLPPRIARQKVRVTNMVPLEVQIPRGWFGPGGNLDIAVKRAKPGLTLGLRPDSIKVMSEPHNFEWNFAKALLNTFLLWMVVLALTMAGSTVLSGPVNLIFGLSVFVAGSMVGFVRESLPTVQERIQFEEKEAKDAQAAGEEPTVRGGDIPVPVLKFSQAVSRISLQLIPDLNTFDASAPILRGIDIPPSRIWEGLKFALAYMAGSFLAGLAFLRMREFR